MSNWHFDSEQIGMYREDGYFIARELLSADEVDLLGRIARADQGMKRAAYGRADGEGGVVQLTVANELPEDSIYGAIVRSRRVVDTMEALLGGEVYHYHHKMIQKEPRVGGAWTW